MPAGIVASAAISPEMQWITSPSASSQPTYWVRTGVSPAGGVSPVAQQGERVVLLALRGGAHDEPVALKEKPQRGRTGHRQRLYRRVKLRGRRRHRYLNRRPSSASRSSKVKPRAASSTRLW